MENSVECTSYQHTLQTRGFTAYSLWMEFEYLGKSKKNMDKSVNIVICWSIHIIGFQTDIKKMYNSVKLEEDYWCLQQYIWQKDLDPQKLPGEKVIKTLIYGVKEAYWKLQDCQLKNTHKSGEKNVAKALQVAVSF